MPANRSITITITSTRTISSSVGFTNYLNELLKQDTSGLTRSLRR